MASSIPSPAGSFTSSRCYSCLLSAGCSTVSGDAAKATRAAVRPKLQRRISLESGVWSLESRERQLRLRYDSRLSTPDSRLFEVEHENERLLAILPAARHPFGGWRRDTSLGAR